MKKKILILTAASMLSISGALAFGLSAKTSKSNSFMVKAVEREFTFDRAVGAEQFEGHYVDQKPAEVSVVTGVSSNLETKVSFPKSSTDDYGKYFGDLTYNSFVRTAETYSSAELTVEIGVNNPTSVSVTFCLIKTLYTAASEVGCRISVFNGDDFLDQTYSSGDSCINDEFTFTWNKKGTQETPADKVKIELEAKGGSVYFGEPLYIKDIHLNWAC